MLIFTNFLDIFQFLNLVDILWSVPKLGRTNLVSREQFNRFEYCTSDFLAFCAQVAWTHAHIEYM